METKLTDFTATQLMVMISAVENMRRDKENLGCFSAHSEDDINLVRAQLLTAYSEVKFAEKTVQN
jgi:hypothetical protein